jgi:hypothetical protein
MTCAHAFRVENLVAAANLEDGGEELGVLLEAAVTDHLLARLIVRRHGQSCHKKTSSCSLYSTAFPRS